MSYPTPAEAKVVAAAEKLMEETMARYDPSHDAFHVQRVRRTALHIARTFSLTQRKPDLLVVELSALLHDVLDKKYVSASQASDPYAFFLPFFQKVNEEYGVDLITDNRAQEVAKIVTNVSWSTEKKLREKGELGEWHKGCVELHCVQDADRLDAIGAFGILRCAAYSSSVNRPLHTPEGDPAHGDSSIQHFYDKLLHIREQLKTDEGKRLAEKRHQFMLDFLAATKEEYEML
ncbi:hypothetical protein BDY19DRAFT_899102 [Irpex rosettiformis]|uniref:Uncharacterized protein n=1 Tax=Irpex rosettiformis TaxID=378272 RepID=A0ACB8TPT4_9APHY|nr:hypothetical protein BDY19DRAFT_899102 [Irpex rosettiformis]